MLMLVNEREYFPYSVCRCSVVEYLHSLPGDYTTGIPSLVSLGAEAAGGEYGLTLVNLVVFQVDWKSNAGDLLLCLFFMKVTILSNGDKAT